jgi:uncharacterized protein involved in exopolysaccharide biosynthesis
MSESTVKADGAGVRGRMDVPYGDAGPLPGVRLVVRRLWWVALAAAVGLAAGLVLAAQGTDRYESTALVSITTTTPQEVTDMTRVAQALARVATAPGIVTAPLREAGQADAAADPRRYITVESSPNAPLVSLSGLATDPDEAQAIAQAVLSAVAEVDAFGGFDVVVVSPPALPTEPTRPAWVVPAGLAALCAALAFIIAAAVPGQDTSGR